MGKQRRPTLKRYAVGQTAPCHRCRSPFTVTEAVWKFGLWICNRCRAEHRTAWQTKMLDSGRCVTCGRPRNRYLNHCDGCNSRPRERSRKHRGSKPYRPDAAGRVPFEILERLGDRRGVGKCEGCRKRRALYDGECCAACLLGGLAVGGCDGAD